MIRPKPRPSSMKKRKSGAPTKSLRPKARPVDDGGAVARGNRAAMREAIDAATLTMPEGQNMKAGGMAKKGYKAGGKMPDLSGDGKVTQKDVLIGRGVIKKKAGGMMKKKGYAKGGMMKKGYAAGGKAKGAAKGGKVRGAGIARKGVRPAKML